ncbi:MAG: CBS domain-containing protein [Pseudomonadota bacterium]
MAEASKNSILSDATVNEAMRVRIFSLPVTATIGRGIRHLIKYKINACLLRGDDGAQVGVVSKTDIMGAYYAGLPIESPLDHIMVSPPLFCRPGDSLESVLDTMRSRRVYRLYVLDESRNDVVGAIAYPDIVGLLYGYCRSCDRSIMNRRKELTENPDFRIKVKEVMTDTVVWFYDHDDLFSIMEGIAERRCSSVLIRSGDGKPSGVISKTDLILAYSRAVPTETRAADILASQRVISCQESTYLEDAVRTMILYDLQRLFVWSESPESIVGVISLSDAARVRSGSCHACAGSRVKVE